MEYYINKDDKQTGPFTIGQLRSMWSSGSLTTATLFWHEGATGWLPLRTISTDLEPIPTPKHAVTPEPQTISTTRPTIVRTAKSRGIYIILGLFFGLLGVHNFYAGHYRPAIWQLVTTILFFWTAIVPVAVFIWIIFELCTVKSDSNGEPLS